MVYYIFASRKLSHIKSAKKDAIFVSVDLNEALEKMDELSKDIDFVSKYKFAYLILHIGMPVSSGSRKNSTLLVDVERKMVPFIVIQRYYFDNKPIVEDVNNSITVETEGFREEFITNKYAAAKFNKYYNSLQAAKLVLNYRAEDGQEDSIVIGDTVQIMKYRAASQEVNYTFDINDEYWDNGIITDFDRIALSNAS